MELEVSSDAPAHAHGEEKQQMNFRNEQVCSVCRCDCTSPSHAGQVLGTAQQTLQRCPLGQDCLNAASAGAVPDPAPCLQPPSSHPSVAWAADRAGGDSQARPPRLLCPQRRGAQTHTPVLLGNWLLLLVEKATEQGETPELNPLSSSSAPGGAADTHTQPLPAPSGSSLSNQGLKGFPVLSSLAGCPQTCRN